MHRSSKTLAEFVMRPNVPPCVAIEALHSAAQ